MTILFAGTSEFAATILQALIDAGKHIPLVLTQPDRPAGRGMPLRVSAVKRLSLQQGISLEQPHSLRQGNPPTDEEKAMRTLLREIQADAMVVVAYGLMIPPDILGIPRYGCINIHASLLPRWRGAAPIQRAIEAGDKTTGISIMRMDAGLDTGPILLQQSVPITQQDTANSLHDRLATLGGEMIVLALNRLASLTESPQTHQYASYAKKISKEESTLDFSLSASLLANKVRAFNPTPGAQAHYADTLLKIWHAEALPAPHRENAGQIVCADTQEGLVVACGEGLLRITEIQKPGGKRLSTREFLRGFPMEKGRFTDRRS
ncbi:MAG: methionyl-tRNA formyltransferase [Burkholderiaceae bacterium]|jgi:methionyl-tRNA formyltransferase|nr:methionyl-tRNA formyltransferase [Burkholderiaceae bacterium]